MVPNSIILRASAQSMLAGVTVNIYQLKDGVYVITPAGYDQPKEATFLGSVDRNGNFAAKDTDSIQERD